MRLIASTKPDKIELETALNRWAEASWFLDEAEIDSSQTGPDGTRTLPANRRLGNRPNLRQMHDDACANRVSDARVEEELLNTSGIIARSLTARQPPEQGRTPSRSISPRHRGRRRVPLRRPGPGGGVRVRQAKRAEPPVYQRIHQPGPPKSESQRHHPGRPVQGRFDPSRIPGKEISGMARSKGAAQRPAAGG